jgi:hypothetical protein
MATDAGLREHLAAERIATAPPSFGDAGAGGAIVAGSDEATAGMLRR